MSFETLSAVTRTQEYFEILKYSFFLSLVVQCILHSYLIINKAIERSFFLARHFPSEILGRFRDYTKKEKSPLHFLYYIQLFLIFGTIILFIPAVLADINFSNPIVRIASIPISIIIILIGYVGYVQLSDKYYK
ncbi:MAG: hypothetical protein CSA18_04855 [Deltaproteobacteria bacterium]|nr:MAG: hypothetical protein CSA18_04855 [Deltaproteobacteria bacterium]